MDVHRVVTMAVGFAIALAAAVVAPAPAAASGKHVTQSLNGLTCRSSWYNTYGGTKCTGDPDSPQKWRLRVNCQMQSDHKGPWNYDEGSDGYECSFGITGAGVEWGDS